MEELLDDLGRAVRKVDRATADSMLKGLGWRCPACGHKVEEKDGVLVCSNLTICGWKLLIEEVKRE